VTSFDHLDEVIAVLGGARTVEWFNRAVALIAAG